MRLLWEQGPHIQGKSRMQDPKSHNNPMATLSYCLVLSLLFYEAPSPQLIVFNILLDFKKMF
jgi:hypothetical protein